MHDDVAIRKSPNSLVGKSDGKEPDKIFCRRLKNNVKTRYKGMKRAFLVKKGISDRLETYGSMECREFFST
jgi:hypothetical protein